MYMYIYTYTDNTIEAHIAMHTQIRIHRCMRKRNVYVYCTEGHVRAHIVNQGAV